MKYSVQCLPIFLLSLLFLFCKRERADFAPTVNFNVTVRNDLSVLVAGAKVSFFKNYDEYLSAINSGNHINATTSLTDANGAASLTLDPETEYWLLVSYYDLVRNFNLNNVNISGKIKPLPMRTKVFVELQIRPIDGIIIFYTDNPNKMPLDITVKTSKNYPTTNYSLNASFSGTNVPNTASPNVVVVPRDSGTFTYNVKSPDGCAWQGYVNVEKGNTYTVNLPLCLSSSISFYTVPENDSLLPLSVVLNRRDTIGTVTSSRFSMDCNSDKSNSLTVDRVEGQYTYLVTSKSQRCVWTGNINIVAGACTIVPIGTCE